MDKFTLIGMLERMALLLELKGENPFKVKAYLKGATALEGTPGEPSEWVATGELRRIPGIGAGLAAMITECLQTGSSSEFEQLQAEIPPTLLDLLSLPQMGPKKVKTLHDSLGIRSLEDLERAVQAGQLGTLAGFGQKTQDKLREALEKRRSQAGLLLYPEALQVASDLLEGLRAVPGIQEAEIVGEVRRHLEVVSDIILLAACSDSDWLARLQPLFASLEPVGPQQARGRLDAGHGFSMFVVPPEDFAAKLVELTGSEEHLQQLSMRAQARSLRFETAGLWRDGARLGISNEAAFYRELGLDWVPPELREGLRSLDDPLPTLLEARDLQGIFHCHTTWSDGTGTLEQMALGAWALGYRYIGIADHSPAAFYAQGLSVERLKEQQAEIDRLNSTLEGIRILKGTEADILADGTVDYPPEVLAGFDYVVASIHSRFGMPPAEMTERIVRALRNPFVTMLGHMTGRLLLEREAYGLELDRIFEVAAAEGVAIEVNANPHRLDLDWRYIPRALAAGVRLVINPDAHSVQGLSHMRYGVGIARKGGASAAQVLNTMGREELGVYLAQRRDRARSLRN